MNDKTTDKFQPLQAALTALAAAGVSVKFAEIYHCGTTSTPIVLENVTIDERGGLAMMDAKITHA